MIRAPEGAVLGRRAHRELVEVRLCDNDRACLAETRDDSRLERTAVVLEDARAAGRRRTQCGDVVLDDHGNSSKRTAPACRHTLAETIRLVMCRRLVAPEERIEAIGAGTHLPRARERFVEYLMWRSLARDDGLTNRGHSLHGRAGEPGIDHGIGSGSSCVASRGTRKNPSRVIGAKSA